MEKVSFESGVEHSESGDDDDDDDDEPVKDEMTATGTHHPQV